MRTGGIDTKRAYLEFPTAVSSLPSSDRGDGEKGAAHGMPVVRLPFLLVTPSALRVANVGHVGVNVLKRTCIGQPRVLGRICDRRRRCLVGWTRSPVPQREQSDSREEEQKDSASC